MGTISGLTREEERKLLSVLGHVQEQYGDIRSPWAIGSAIALLQVEVLTVGTSRDANKWVYQYVLADLLASEGKIAEAFNAAQACYRIRPEDPRSTYALGTTYNTLTRAKHADNPEIAEVGRQIAAKTGEPYDPVASREALKSLGITLDEAAQRAIEMFSKTLQADIPHREAAMLRRHIEGLLKDFPYLRNKVDVPHRQNTSDPDFVFCDQRQGCLGLLLAIGVFVGSLFF